MFKSQKSVEAGVQGELFKVSKRSLPPAERVRMLQEKLYCKAKQERDYKFYILYDKLFIPYMLQEGYKKVKENGGSPGIDGENFTDIERNGLEDYLKSLGEELRKRTYQPQAVKRVWIDKANGGKRPLGIPTIKDRIVQATCKMLIEPIYEADFEDSSYGFRPKRSSKDAMKAIKEHLQSGKTEVLDADLSSYFDTIPHDRLMIVLKQRISDPRLLDLIEKWLKSPIYEDGKFTGGKKNKEGTPQGGVISPLLANIYMHLVDRMVNNIHRVFYKAGIKIVRYADDFVLMGKRITKEVIEKLKNTLSRMGLKLNETKTRLIQAQDSIFDFLGFTIRYDKDILGRSTRYWNIQASNKSMNKIREKISEHLHKSGHHNPKQVAQGLNAIIRGWLNYYEIPKVSYPTMKNRALRHYLMKKLNRYYNRKSQRRSGLYGHQAFELLVAKHGLIDPTKYHVRNSM
ncbi:MAG TPA: group II intron reverse transcriptase/maturase [Saprospiraceae bacterium]|nr:group II intron reverse transcriptase/maturase [Saprospiraceae bacterium]